jgi:hypothetical protein
MILHPLTVATVLTEAPTICRLTEIDLLSNWPVGYGASLQLLIHNITPFSQWPAPFGNGLFG